MFLFRVDGNAAIGAGHVMRCLTIADSLKQRGQKCLFVMASGEFGELIRKHGHEVDIIDADYARMETEELIPDLNRYFPSMVIVDSYYVSECYMIQLHGYLKKKGIKLAYIDDRYSFPYSCDLLINYNIFADLSLYNELFENATMPSMILGTSYTPLRDEFGRYKDRELSFEANTVFVSTGGADIEHLTVSLLQSASESKLKYVFIVGALNNDKEEIYRFASTKDNISIKENVSNISSVMLSCDIAISAAGSTLYELCAMQTPTITYVLADNQIPAAEAFENKGIMKNCGDVRVIGKKTISDRLIRTAEELAENYEERLRMSRAMKEIVDGRGGERIADKLMLRC